jgi:hypothetical protein
MHSVRSFYRKVVRGSSGWDTDLQIGAVESCLSWNFSDLFLCARRSSSGAAVAKFDLPIPHP